MLLAGACAPRAGATRAEPPMTENAVECALAEGENEHANFATRRYAERRRAKGENRARGLHIRPRFRSSKDSPPPGSKSRRARRGETRLRAGGSVRTGARATNRARRGAGRGRGRKRPGRTRAGKHPASRPERARCGDWPAVRLDQDIPAPKGRRPSGGGCGSGRGGGGPCGPSSCR